MARRNNPAWSPSHAEQLRDERWLRRRDDILGQYPVGCSSCGAEDVVINVHHRYYEAGRMAWEYEDKSLVPLCQSCHAKADHLRRRIVRATGMLGEGQAERATGYMEALEAELARPLGVILVRSYEHAIGVGDVFSLTADEVLDEAFRDVERRVAVRRLFELSQQDRHIRTVAAWKNAGYPEAPH